MEGSLVTLVFPDDQVLGTYDACREFVLVMGMWSTQKIMHIPCLIQLGTLKTGVTQAILYFWIDRHGEHKLTLADYSEMKSYLTSWYGQSGSISIQSVNGTNYAQRDKIIEQGMTLAKALDDPHRWLAGLG